jgi:hypothetical protein
VLDYANGGVVAYLKALGVSFRHIHVEQEASLLSTRYDFVMTNLLSGKALLDKKWIDRSSGLFLWMTYPADAYKWLPLATLLNGMPFWWMKTIAFIHKSQSRRISRTLQSGMDKGGIVLMDEECWRFNRCLFAVDGDPAIIPICTDGKSPVSRRSFEQSAPQVVWVGRLTDFKTKALLNFLRTAHANLTNCPLGTCHVVGDGSDRGLIECFVREETPGLNVIFHGQMNPLYLGQFIAAEADIFVGHGTSVLEAAQAGVPSILVDPSYVDVSPDRFRAEWIGSQGKGNVGRIIHHPSEYAGRQWHELYAEYLTNPHAVGKRCRAAWEANHDPEKIATLVHEAMVTSRYSVSDFIFDGGASVGAIGWGIERIKNIAKWVRRKRLKKPVDNSAI